MTDAIREQLAAKVVELEAENARLREGIKAARIYAGDNLPAASGLVVVSKLEKALKESKYGRKD